MEEDKNKTPAGGNANPTAGDQGGKKQDGDGDGTPKTYTEEELQAERDRIASKVRAEEKAKADKDKAQAIANAKAEAERQAKLSEEERVKEQRQKEEEEFNARKQALDLQENTIEAKVKLAEYGIPDTTIPFLISADKEKTMTNIEEFKKVWDKAIESGVEKKLAGKTLKDNNPTGKKSEAPKAKAFF